MKKLLLHICCGPCASPVIANLSSEFEVTGYYFNPNIFPVTEFEKRLNSVRKVAKHHNIDLIIPELAKVPNLGKGGNDFFEYIGETKNKPARCILCYKQRLSRTAEYAKANGFDGFSTTLLISPFQYHEDLKRIGEEVAEEFGITFYYQDFRPLYKESRELAGQMDLYLQKYCGCKFSRKRK